MKNWLKQHPVKATLLLALLIFIVLPASLNYSGFCISQGRWLSDEELMVSAFNEINNRSTTTINISDTESVVINRIPYLSYNEFINENPNCCYAGRKSQNDGNGYMSASLTARILGSSAAVISLSYKERYFNESNEKQEKNKKQILSVSNCGRAISDDWF